VKKAQGQLKKIRNTVLGSANNMIRKKKLLSIKKNKKRTVASPVLMVI
jgi:hypothetical protein